MSSNAPSLSQDSTIYTGLYPSVYPWRSFMPLQSPPMAGFGIHTVGQPATAALGSPPSTFASEKTHTNCADRLVRGSNREVLGQCLIINDCLDSGTQFPYIKWGIENNYGIIVANTNINEATVNGQEVEIRGSKSPEMHTESIWKGFVQNAKAKQIAIVAHSYGGVCTLELAIKFTNEFKDRVFAVALTDSVHSLGHQEASEEVIEYYKERAKNWASSYDPLDTPLETRLDSCPTVSAGTDKHEYTSFSCMHSVFKFFEEKFCERHSSQLSVKKESIKSDSRSADGEKSSENAKAAEPKVDKGDNSVMSQDVLSQDDINMASQSQDMLSQGDTDMASQSQDMLSQEDMGSQSQGDTDMASQGDTHIPSRDVTSVKKEEL
ncbi:hypothetical protein FSP39_009330 [Pinctada imbricata]|uniref:Arb2 domain-containing protein n=1 Tax=Pinctada imbricata TaxID=66713 RepID=A0AA88Y3J9_PINIB|nr:hypothetical protein FSP39_009330 [Pinctada imbricata]